MYRSLKLYLDLVMRMIWTQIIKKLNRSYTWKKNWECMIQVLYDNIKITLTWLPFKAGKSTAYQRKTGLQTSSNHHTADGDVAEGGLVVEWADVVAGVALGGGVDDQAMGEAFLFDRHILGDLQLTLALEPLALQERYCSSSTPG